MIQRFRFIMAVIVFLCSVGSASGQSCTSYPYTLTNGTTADASQVMANFAYVLGCINSGSNPATMRGWLAGLTMANDATTPNTTIDVAAGVADSDDATYLMSLTSFTKNTSAAWAVGTGNGCLDSGSSLAANQWYHMFVIARTDTGVVDLLCSTSATGPTFPASYTKKRRIGSFRTNGSSQIYGFSQNGDEFLWKTSIADSTTNPLALSGSAQMALLLVPSGVQVNALFRSTANAGSINVVLFTSPDENDQAVGSPNNDLVPAGTYAAGRFNVRTNTASQIRVRGTSGASLWIGTYGWVDTRGRFQ